MDILLFIYTKEQQVVIFFLWAAVIPGALMHRRMSLEYGNSVLSQ